MAFKKQNVASQEAEPIATDTTADAIPAAHILWGDKKLLVSELPVHAVQYLLQQGATKVRSDVAGGLPKQHRDEGKTKEESDALIAALHDKRLVAIMEGTTVTRALGPRLEGIERMLRIVARERVLDKAAKLGKEAPKGKAMLDIIEMLIKLDPKVRQIAELRMSDDDGAEFPVAL
jgi:hypothetical protein